MKCPGCKAGVQEWKLTNDRTSSSPSTSAKSICEVPMNSTHLRCTTIYPFWMEKKKKAIVPVVNSKDGSRP